ncbi:hypothetical protein [Streptomyces sp. NPDC058664]|uniref:hypothetical protein n=1 Tax=unclassified Streptomyces TaxID=2593676 RepID=UPI00365A827A
MPTQNRWRYCYFCRSLFYDGFEKGGVCSAAPNMGEHVPHGYEFHLTYNEVPIPAIVSQTYQSNWRNCPKCQCLMFNGHDNYKGACPAGGEHGKADYDFHLMHWWDTTDYRQDGWRACWKCLSLFYEGVEHSPKGVCPKGGEHEGHGDLPTTFDFALEFPMNLHASVKANGAYSVYLIGSGFTPKSDARFRCGWTEKGTGKIHRVIDQTPIVVRSDRNGSASTRFDMPVAYERAGNTIEDVATGTGTWATEDVRN